MDDLFSRLMEHWNRLLGRPNGPLGFRFILQPAISLFFAVRDGRNDARLGKPPYLGSILFVKGGRWSLLGDGLLSVARVLAFGLLLDGIYQVIVFKWFYPLEAVVLSLVLDFIPYLLLRGPVNRMHRGRQK